MSRENHLIQIFCQIEALAKLIETSASGDSEAVATAANMIHNMANDGYQVASGAWDPIEKGDAA